MGRVHVGVGAPLLHDAVNSYDESYNALDARHAGDEVDIKLSRDGAIVSVPVDLVVTE